MKLIEGDVIELKKGMKVYTKIPATYAYSNTIGDFSLVEKDVVIGDYFDNWLSGKYVVIKTNLEGGGTGHGDNDVYPDGHRVYCEKIDNREIKCNFYQTGAFTAMIKDIKPIGRAELTYVIKN